MGLKLCPCFTLQKIEVTVVFTENKGVIFQKNHFENKKYIKNRILFSILPFELYNSNSVEKLDWTLNSIKYGICLI